jgi:hypothetical protein
MIPEPRDPVVAWLERATATMVAVAGVAWLFAWFR